MTTLIDLLDNLSSREVTGHAALNLCCNFIKDNFQYKDIILRILSKDLKCRTGAILINSVYPGLIPEFKVALAEDYFKQKNVDLNSGNWYWSRKLDGVRCICRKEGDSIRFFSREGNEFWVLDVLREDIKRLELGNIVFDGEICLVDENGKENFQNVMKEIRRKDHTIKNPRYMIFDMLTIEEFDSQTSKYSHLERQRRLGKLIGSIDDLNFDRLRILQQHYIHNEEDFNQAIEKASQEGWEGLILRKDVPYEGKRTKNMLKVKKMHDAEYKVTDVTLGYIDDGHGNKVTGMTAVIIDHKGYQVKVGSGWSYDQRIQYFNDPAAIIGKVITVKYFEETKNQEGGYSLRFPIVKAIHGEKREI